VLWSLRTSPNRLTGYTPFFMVYGDEAVLPSDLDHGSPRVKAYEERRSEEAHQDALDRLDEARDIVLIRSTKYQQGLRRYHGWRVKARAFEVSDLVLRKVQSNADRHKLSPPWEGPYTVAEVLRPRTFKLSNADGNIFTNAWNIENLRPFYP
jgi:hypothetical protein